MFDTSSSSSIIWIILLSEWLVFCHKIQFDYSLDNKTKISQVPRCHNLCVFSSDDLLFKRLSEKTSNDRVNEKEEEAREKGKKEEKGKRRKRKGREERECVVCGYPTKNSRCKERTWGIWSFFPRSTRRLSFKYNPTFFSSNNIRSVFFVSFSSSSSSSPLVQSMKQHRQT